jgi:hypothetical protein
LESIELTPDDLRDLETAASIQLKTEDEYENEAKIDVFNLAGATLFSWRDRAQGRRIKLEPFE